MSKRNSKRLSLPSKKTSLDRGKDNLSTILTTSKVIGNAKSASQVLKLGQNNHGGDEMILECTSGDLSSPSPNISNFLKVSQDFILSTSAPPIMERKRRRNAIDCLHSALSPKYLDLSLNDRRKSRTGRQKSIAELQCLTALVSQTPAKRSKTSLASILLESSSPPLDSPVDRLIQKNKMLAKLAKEKNNLHTFTENNVVRIFKSEVDDENIVCSGSEINDETKADTSVSKLVENIEQSEISKRELTSTSVGLKGENKKLSTCEKSPKGKYESRTKIVHVLLHKMTDEQLRRSANLDCKYQENANKTKSNSSNDSIMLELQSELENICTSNEILDTKSEVLGYYENITSTNVTQEDIICVQNVDIKNEIEILDNPIDENLQEVEIHEIKADVNSFDSSFENEIIPKSSNKTKKDTEKGITYHNQPKAGVNHSIKKTQKHWLINDMGNPRNAKKSKHSPHVTVNFGSEEESRETSEIAESFVIPGVKESQKKVRKTTNKKFPEETLNETQHTLGERKESSTNIYDIEQPRFIVPEKDETQSIPMTNRIETIQCLQDDSANNNRISNQKKVTKKRNITAKILSNKGKQSKSLETDAGQESTEASATNFNVTSVSVDERRDQQSQTCPNSRSLSSPDAKAEEVEVDIFQAPLLKKSNENLSLPSIVSSDSARGSSVDVEIGLKIEIGDVFWGQIPPYPYWPCMVWPDPDGRTISIETHRFHKNPVNINVRFFADNGRRGWVNQDQMVVFNGIAEFEKIKDQLTLKKSNYKHKMFRFGAKVRALWRQAAAEAENALLFPHEQRCKIFEDILSEARLKSVQERARRRSIYVSAAKSDTTEDSSVTAFKRKRTLSTETENDVSSDNPKQLSKRFKTNSHAEVSSRRKTTTKLRQEARITSKEIEKFFDVKEYKKFENKVLELLDPTDDNLIESEILSNIKRLWLRNNEKNHNIYRTYFLSSVEITTQQLERHERLLQKPIQVERRSMWELVEDSVNLPKNYLLKNLSRDPVCIYCRISGSVVKCAGNCQNYVHPHCVDGVEIEPVHVTGELGESHCNVISTQSDEGNAGPSSSRNYLIYCKECLANAPSECFVCKLSKNKTDSDLFRCNISSCGKYYHKNCLEYWPQCRFTLSSGKVESFICPAHVCQTCVSDDPRGKFLQIEKQKLAKCIECPATYHLDSFCIPAGTVFLTAIQIICPRHGRTRKTSKKLHLSANFCFLCLIGGSLICCDTCPNSVHVECQNMPKPDENEGFICEECQSGRLPLYAELVWAKMGKYRWWPAFIVPPVWVPLNLRNKKFLPHDFCVRFFGTNDYAWMCRDRVFFYEEGDWGKITTGKSLEITYKNGLEEAKQISEFIKVKKLEMAQKDSTGRKLQPAPYIKLKSNRPVPPVRLQQIENDRQICNCKRTEVNPCGFKSGCLNRALMTECNPKMCPAGEECQNQMFKKRQYPSLEVRSISGKGFGLVCLEEIKSDSFIIEYVGEIINDEELGRRISEKHEIKDENFYFLTLENNLTIDAGPKGNPARFMNHSCEPNCITQKWNVNGFSRIGLFAIKDIPANTELTFNYYLECVGDVKKECHCGTTRCAGFIGEKYKEREVLMPQTKNKKELKELRKKELKKKELKKKKKLERK